MNLFRVVLLVLSLLMAVTGYASGSAESAVAKAVLIDVRTAVEYRAEHLEGALNIPYDVITESTELTVPDRKTKVILYCRTGRRSGIALEALKKAGYEDVIDLMTVKGASEKLGIPIIKGEK